MGNQNAWQAECQAKMSGEQKHPNLLHTLRVGNLHDYAFK